MAHLIAYSGAIAATRRRATPPTSRIRHQLFLRRQGKIELLAADGCRQFQRHCIMHQRL